MADSAITGLHWVRYGIAPDQKYFLDEFALDYDQIVIGANMVAHMPAAISTFVTQKAMKPFIIDPQTHAFQHDVENLLSTSKKSSGELKNSWRGLVKSYGPPLDVLSDDEPRPLSPTDLKDQAVLEGFCERVILFQRDAIKGEMEKGKDSKYLKFLAKRAGTPGGTSAPALLIAPYFFMGGPGTNEWARVNLRCLKASLSFCKQQRIDTPVAAQVVISKDLLTDSEFDRIFDYYRESGVRYFLLWIDNFQEQRASLNQLERLIELVKLLARDGAQVVNLYGGFFSVAQARVGDLQDKLCAVCHGLEHSESKPVVPVSGGIPVAKFYSNNLHYRLPPRVAYQEISAKEALDSVTKYFADICDCAECRRHIKTSPRKDFIRAYGQTNSKSVWRSGQWVTMQFPTSEAADYCTRHYMHCKAVEYRAAYTKTQLKQDLIAARNDLEPHLGSDYAGHTAVWARLF